MFFCSTSRPPPLHSTHNYSTVSFLLLFLLVTAVYLMWIFVSRAIHSRHSIPLHFHVVQSMHASHTSEAPTVVPVPRVSAAPVVSVSRAIHDLQPSPSPPRRPSSAETLAPASPVNRQVFCRVEGWVCAPAGQLVGCDSALSLCLACTRP